MHFCRKHRRRLFIRPANRRHGTLRSMFWFPTSAGADPTMDELRSLTGQLER